MKKNLLSLVCAFICFVTFLAACGGTAPTQNTTIAGTSQETVQTATQQTEKQPSLKGNLVFWSWMNESENNAKVYNDCIAEFQNENPDVKITVQYNGRDMAKTIKAAVDAGQQIDIIDMADTGIETLNGNLLKLDDYYAKTYPSTNGKAFIDCLAPGFIKTIKSRAADKTSLYGVPFEPYVVAMFYNKDLFIKAGITSAPKTWAELLDACSKLKAAGITPWTVDDAYAPVLPLFMYNRLFGEDGAAKLSNEDAAWDDPKALQGAKMLEALAQYGSKNVATNKFPAGQQEFATSNIGIYLINGTWFPNEIAKTTGPNFNWGIFPFPAVEGGINGTESGSAGSMALMINKNCKNPDTAFAFIAKMTTGKWDSELSKRAMNCPISLGAEAPVQLVDALPIFANLTNIWQAPGLNANADRSAIIASNFMKLITGKIKAEEFISNCKNKKK